LNTKDSLDDKIQTQDIKMDQREIAKLKGFEGDACNECGSFTLVRNGTCLKCNNCGSTTGCS
jgi:ribonucleoside-diphosphate reductase alpha chain